MTYTVPDSVRLKIKEKMRLARIEMEANGYLKPKQYENNI